jgi:DNA-binding response OmpR family regulator
MERSRKREWTVLAVEREPDLAETLGQQLEEIGHDVLVASSVIQALRWLKTIRPDVLILDVAGLHGFEVYRWIREKTSYREMPILFVAAADQNWDIPDHECWPVSSVLYKPFTFEALTCQLDDLIVQRIGNSLANNPARSLIEQKQLPEMVS